MNVEIWSDIVCPWCYIGKRRFEKALGRFEHADDVQVTWRSFELDPGAPFRPGRSMAEQVASKYGRSLEESRAMLANMDAMAAAEGLDYHLEETTGGNTFAAHRLIHLAHTTGRGADLKEALLHAYFEERRPVSDPEVLAEVAVGIGLDPADVAAVLDSDRFAAEVRADEAEAREIGVTGVPFFLIDRAFGVPGAQDDETILITLRRAWDRSHPTVETVVGTGPSCDGDGCTI